MTKLENRSALESFRNSLLHEQKSEKKKLLSLCSGSGCGAYGTGEVHDALIQELAKHGMQKEVEVKLSGCHGFCERGPLVVIKPKNIFYQGVRVKDVTEIVIETIIKGNTVDRLLYIDSNTGKKTTYEHEVPFYAKQKRLVFGNNG